MYWYFKSQGEPPGVMNLSDIATVEVSDNEVCFKMSPKFCSLFYWIRGFSLVENVTSASPMSNFITFRFNCRAKETRLCFRQTVRVEANSGVTEALIAILLLTPHGKANPPK